MSLLNLVKVSGYNYETMPIINLLIRKMSLVCGDNRSMLYNIKKQILLKKYKSRFVAFLLDRQRLLFIKTSYKYLETVNRQNDTAKRLELILIFYRYIERSEDVIYKMDNLIRTIIKNIRLLCSQNKLFYVYAYSLNITCNMILSCGHLCTEDVYHNFYQCKNHLIIKLKTELLIKNTIDKKLNPHMVDTIISYLNPSYHM